MPQILILVRRRQAAATLASRAPNWVEVLVAGTGIGILDGQGRGLRLAMAKAFLEQSKGIMRIDSEPGEHDASVAAG